MKELSLNVLDIVENSVKAGAKLTEIALIHSRKTDSLDIIITDNGCGMTAEFVQKVIDPFTTTRTTRKVGLGIPLFKLAAEQTGGNLKIESAVGSGTTVSAHFVPSNIDCAPIGDMGDTFVTLLRGHPTVDFIYRRELDGESFSVDTREIREVMQGVPIDSYEVTSFVREMICENTNELYIGAEIL